MSLRQGGQHIYISLSARLDIHFKKTDNEVIREYYLFKYSYFLHTTMRFKLYEIEKVVRNWRSIPSNHPGRYIEMAYNYIFTKGELSIWFNL
jgi:hypothetical protein